MDEPTTGTKANPLITALADLHERALSMEILHRGETIELSDPALSGKHLRAAVNWAKAHLDKIPTE
jgi:hypothetical protein